LLMQSKRPVKKLRIGITGGIGSGKTLACKYFRQLGYKVIYADDIAKQLYRTNKNLKRKLVNEFGEGILDKNGNISGSNSRRIIFSGRKNIKRVNKIVHPFVIKEIDRLISGIKNKTILIETAIMFESGYYKKLDYTVLIYANKENRIKRVRKRDKVSAAEIKKLMKLQMDEREKLKLADFVIKNNSTSKCLYGSIKSFNKILSRL